MKCYDPKLCYIDKTTQKRSWRHFSLATDEIRQQSNIPFNCGKCIFCLKKRAYELSMRCVLHSSCYTNNMFLTLTYDETKPTYHNNFDYTEIQKFKKRYRKSLDHKIEIFNVHEYGENGKKHWHLVVFNHEFKDKEEYKMRGEHMLYTSNDLADLWPFGFNTIGSVTEASAMYQAQYTLKDLKNGNTNNSKASDSQHSGLGKPFFQMHWKQLLSLGYIPFDGHKVPLPRYFEKLADKHYSHFYEPSKFFDTMSRKRVYTPFKNNEQNLEIANLYKNYVSMKQDKIKILEEEWENVIIQSFDTKREPDFVKAAQNKLYDFNNRYSKGEF